MRFNPKVVFGAACLGMLLFGIGLITLGSVALPLASKFGLGPIESGTLFFILPLGILTGSLAFGPLCDRYGYKPVLVISCLCMFAGFQGIAYAASIPILKICIFLFGLAGGAINGATNAVVADISKVNKGANLSLLGVFFALGSISVPSILGVLQNRFRFEVIISGIGFLTIVACIVYILVRFPAPKQHNGISMRQVSGLVNDGYLWMIAFFLFLVSSLEGVINNWTTTYLETHLAVPRERALFALSSYVIGMAVMRVLLGSIFRKVKTTVIMYGSLVILLGGSLLLMTSGTYTGSVSGLVIMGIGLAAGFPVMLGLVGSRYAHVSGTAFSFVLVIALVGNMLINYLMGVVTDAFGIQHMTTVALLSIICMLLLSIRILQSHKQITV